MSTIRNARVAAGQVSPGSAANLYVVPADHALLLKSIVLSPAAAAAWTYQVGLFAAIEGVAVTLTLANKEATELAAEWSGWTALNAGDALFMSVTGATVNYWVAGALLPTQLL